MGFMGLRNSPFQGAKQAVLGHETGRFSPSNRLFRKPKKHILNQYRHCVFWTDKDKKLTIRNLQQLI